MPANGGKALANTVVIAGVSLWLPAEAGLAAV